MVNYGKYLSIAAGAVLGFVNANADAQVAPLSATTVPVARGPLAADVMGVRLHASPAAARAALLKAGYRIDTVSQVPSFDEQVRAEVASRRRGAGVATGQAGTGTMIATGPHQEFLQIMFMQTPAGSEVSDVSLRVPATAVPAETFRRQFVARYGPPDASRHDGAELSWCSPETRANCGRQVVVSGPLDNLYPLLFVSAYGPGDERLVHLQIGETALNDLAKAREAAVQRLTLTIGAEARS